MKVESSSTLFIRLAQDATLSGWALYTIRSQGSRETRQPWAKLPNRFAVRIPEFTLVQTFLQFVEHPYKRQTEFWRTSQAVTNLRFSQGFIRIIQILQTQRHIGIKIETCALACLKFHCAGGGNHGRIVRREVK